MIGYAICECSNPECRLRYPASFGDKAYSRCPACHAPVLHYHKFLQQEAERHVAGDAKVTLKLHALLDNIRSVYNVGSIFRSADGAGFDTLYLCGVTPTPDNPKLAKTALGAHMSMRWEAWPNAMDLAQQLQATRHHLWALEEGERVESLFDVPPPPAHTVLVVGNEVTGVDPDLLRLCEHTVAIPMRGVKRSLNVATAFGIAALILSSRMELDRQEDLGARPA
jgi:tRNA G18 (ribose-2'-O)-methylase SpoU